MKAVMIHQPGGIEQLYLGDTPTPEPQADELLVKVHATALNRADIAQRQGFYPPPPGASEIMGLEMAGVVEEVGSQCSGWKKGDRVCGLLPGGGYAEYAVIPGEMALSIPDSMTLEEAAAIPEVFLTAYQTLFWLGQLTKGQTVLIHAGASGVGTAAIQLAREAQARVMTTAGSEEKLQACRSLGAEVAIHYKEGPFEPKVLEATSQKGVDVILDFVGAPYWVQNLNCLNVDGRLVLISTMGGSKVEQFNLRAFMMKRVHVMGTTLRARSKDYKIALTQAFATEAYAKFSDGRLKPVVDKVFPWEKVAEAHQYMEENRNIGKIVLRVTSP